MGLFDQSINKTGMDTTYTVGKTSATPWAPTAQPLKTLTSSIKGWMQQPTLSPMAQQGIGLLGNVGSNPLYSGAATYLQGAMTPEMSPYASQIADQASKRAINQVKAQYSMAGRYGSNASDAAMIEASMNAQLPFLNQEWNNMQDRAMQATSMAPQMAMMPAQGMLQGGLLGDQVLADRLKTSGGLLGVLASLGGEKTTAGTTLKSASESTTKPSGTLNDISGLLGLLS